ncbi:hypothetical protein CALVIDRAFT_168541 [Calocera viscosa TUFC12733]|uniref:Uncharacterized protein n=1 Tax=Calocera viscosa (strain TUFC12733) TaxID=1330018 RepID=A0A167L6B9_CALVF|nr:hypothetical protein CALVIDRAFT_168541 [Calocera viscosa TUFC12733]
MLQHFRSQIQANKNAISLKVQHLERERPTAARKDRLHQLRQKLVELDCDIDMLPNEILRCIFEIGSRYGADTSYSIIVSHVCQRWRAIALATAFMWSNITLDLPLRKIGRDYLSAFPILTSRAVMCPVNLTVKVSRHGSDATISNSLSFLKRCLIGPDKTGMVAHSRRNSVDSLFTLDFISADLASRLCSLTLSYNGRMSNDDDDGFKNLRGVLERCCAIEILIIEDLYLSDQYEVSVLHEHTVNLPLLRELHLRDNEEEYGDLCCNLLPCIHAPLTTLSFYLPYLDVDVDIPMEWCNALSFADSVCTLNLCCSFDTNISTVVNLLLHLPKLEAIFLEKCCNLTEDFSSVQMSEKYITRLKKIGLVDLRRPGSSKVLMEFLERHGLPRSAHDGTLEVSVLLIWTEGHSFFNAGDKARMDWIWLQENVQTLAYENPPDRKNRWYST